MSIDLNPFCPFIHVIFFYFHHVTLTMFSPAVFCRWEWIGMATLGDGRLFAELDVTS